MLHCKMQSRIEQNTVKVALLCTNHWNYLFYFYLSKQDTSKFCLLKRSIKVKSKSISLIFDTLISLIPRSIYKYEIWQ